MQAYLRKYGIAATIEFELFQIDGVSFRTDAMAEAGDTTLVLDGGTEGSTNNSFTNNGKGYSIVLTAEEMQAALITLFIVDQSGSKQWLDRAIHIETYGHDNAQHRLDFDAAIWTTTLAEDYAATTAEFNAAQALYEICQTLSEFTIIGTTLTVRRRDRETSALVYDLNSATKATSRTRTQ